MHQSHRVVVELCAMCTACEMSSVSYSAKTRNDAIDIVLPQFDASFRGVYSLRKHLVRYVCLRTFQRVDNASRNALPALRCVRNRLNLLTGYRRQINNAEGDQNCSWLVKRNTQKHNTRGDIPTKAVPIAHG